MEIGNPDEPINVTTSKLKVYGLVSAHEVLVTVDQFPDYVFDEKYCLQDLDSVAQYVKTYKHLPGVKSAKEVEEKGKVELGALQLKTLEKLEELYLYVIEMNEKIKVLEAENKNLRKQ